MTLAARSPASHTSMPNTYERNKMGTICQEEVSQRGVIQWLMKGEGIILIGHRSQAPPLLLPSIVRHKVTTPGVGEAKFAPLPIKI